MENFMLTKYAEVQDFQDFAELFTIANSNHVLDIDGKSVSGFDALLWFITFYHGGRVYFPNPRSINKLIDKFIETNCNLKPKELATLLGISETKILSLVKGKNS